MKFLVLPLLAVCSATILGCDSKSSGRDDGIPYYRPANYKGIEPELAAAQLFCASTAACPENVGMIFINRDGSADRPRIAQCTGFLVSEDIVATNSHCIPDHLKVQNSNCEGQVAIRFIEPSGKPSIFGCKQLLDYSPQSNFTAPDYAFFRIEKSGMLPLKIHKQGLSDNQPIAIAKITPIVGARGGRLEVESCKVAIGTLLNLSSVSAWSKTSVGIGCHVTGGNSGSPVLNQDNEVLGIVQAMLTENYSAGINRSFEMFKLELPQNLKPHGIFTNLSCINDPVFGVIEKEKCANDQKLQFTDCIDFENKDSQANSKRVIERWKKELPSVFIYRFTIDPKEITADPVCIKPKASFADYEKFVASEGLVFRKHKLELAYPRSMGMGARLMMDEDYRLKPEVQFVDQTRSTYIVHLVQNNELWSGSMQSASSRWQDRLGLAAEKISITVPFCTDAQLKAGDKTRVRLQNGDIVDDVGLQKSMAGKPKKVCER